MKFPLKGHVVALSISTQHGLTKTNVTQATLLKGLGVDGDVHMGSKIKHRSRVAKNPNQVNLRQVHLIQSELFEDLKKKGFKVKAGQMAENITTSGIDLMTLPKGSVLFIGAKASIKLTGLRNPCNQLNGFQDGLMQAVLEKSKDGELIRLAGVMAIVLTSGEIKPGDNIKIEIPTDKIEALCPV